METGTTNEQTQVANDILKGHIEVQVNNTVDKADLYYPEHLTTWQEKQNYLNLEREMLKRDLNSNLTAQKGKDGDIAFFYNGELQIDHYSGKLLTMDEVLKQQHKWHIRPSKAFTPEQAATAGEGFLKTKSDVMAYLKKKFKKSDIRQGNAKWNAEYIRIVKQQKIEN